MTQVCNVMQNRLCMFRDTHTDIITELFNGLKCSLPQKWGFHAAVFMQILNSQIVML